MEEPVQPHEDYEPPVMVDFGTVRDATLGSSSRDTADMDKARYW